VKRDLDFSDVSPEAMARRRAGSLELMARFRAVTPFVNCVQCPRRAPNGRRSLLFHQRETMNVANIIHVINTTRGLPLFLVLLVDLACLTFAWGHLWEARRWDKETHGAMRPLLMRVGLVFLVLSVVLTVALYIDMRNFHLW
jgi:hypothetical protein